MHTSQILKEAIVIFHVSKLFIENSEDEGTEEFLVKGKCLVCELELTESELEDLNFLD